MRFDPLALRTDRLGARRRWGEVMNRSGRHLRRFRPTGATVLGTIVLGAAVTVPLVLFCLAAWQSYASVIAAAKLRVEQTARILEEHALKVLQTNQLVIEAVDGRLRAAGLDEGPAGASDLHDFLLRLQGEVPEIGTITVADAKGRLRASSRTSPPYPDISFADPDWFQQLAFPAPSARTGPMVSRSYSGRQSGLSIFNIAVPAPPTPGGGFGGVIAISIDRGYFETFYAAVETTYNFSVLLVRDDGEILASTPPTSTTHLSPASRLLAAIGRAPVGSYQARSRLDGIDRFFAYRRIPGFPVFVRFGISRHAALAPWRAAVLAYGFTALLTALCLLATASMALRQTRRWQAAVDALQAEVSERERVEEQLRQSQKMEAIGQLTGGIAHDFNNMLAVVIGGLEMAQRRLARGDAAVTRHIEMASEGAARAAALTQRLLAFARQQPLKPEPVAVNTLVAGLADLLRRTIGETVRLETRLDPGAWRTKVDAGELENVLLNLAVNARDAMPQGGRLTIGTANASLSEAAAGDGQPGDYVVLSVADTGAGMTPAVVARAFEPFFTTKPVGKGTGLGLSQCYGFVRQSGGHVAVETAPERGTVFRLYLPRLDEVASGEGEAVAEVSPPARARAGDVILVVEDEARVRAVSVEALRDLGYAVIQAASGDEALALLRTRRDVSLLLSDVMMPGLRGDELAAAARAEHPGLRVLFTTGHVRDAALPVDASGQALVLSKPFTIDELARRVRDVLEAG